MGNLRWDLGIRNFLWPEWVLASKLTHLRKDFISGITTPTVSIPVSLGAALLSGCPPQWGLMSAIVGGVSSSMFGGIRMGIYGPAAGMALAVAAVVQSVGLDVSH